MRTQLTVASKKSGQRNGWLLPVAGKAAALCVLFLFLICADLRSVTDSMLAADVVLADTEALAAWPNTDIALDIGTVSSGFGFRKDPVSRLPIARRPVKFHAGLDICNVRGTVIRAVGSGTVVFVGEMQGYGRTIIVRHSDKLEVLYAHLLTYGVAVGMKVRRGQPIACMGDTGTRSTGTHLHLEYRLWGQAVDPREFIVGRP